MGQYCDICGDKGETEEIRVYLSTSFVTLDIDITKDICYTCAKKIKTQLKTFFKG